MLVGFCGLILIVPVCAPKPVGVRDYSLGLILCLTMGPALGIALAHLCLRRPPTEPKNPPPARHK
jgi:hypothetical protein